MNMSPKSDFSLLLSYNQMGLIPGPRETEEEFINRVQYCLDLKKILAKEALNGVTTIDNVDNVTSQEVLAEALPQTRSLYSISPTWVPIAFSNDKLAPWHGGCAWIFQMDDSPTTALLQLRKKFASAKNYLGIYERKELIVHELAHVGRMLFEEPKFEEILAYRSAGSAFRKYFGPIIQSAWESLMFVIVLAFSFAIDFYMIAADKPDPYDLSTWVKLGPVLLIIVACMRLWRRQKQFERCLENLKSGLKNEQIANAVIYRLTDLEIEKFGKMSFAQIRKYADDQVQNVGDLRWRIIQEAYML